MKNRVKTKVGCVSTSIGNVLSFFVAYRISYNKRPWRLLNSETVRCGAY